MKHESQWQKASVAELQPEKGWGLGCVDRCDQAHSSKRIASTHNIQILFADRDSVRVEPEISFGVFQHHM